MADRAYRLHDEPEPPRIAFVMVILVASIRSGVSAIGTGECVRSLHSAGADLAIDDLLCLHLHRVAEALRALPHHQTADCVKPVVTGGISTKGRHRMP